jgi:hypothetical protein
MIPVEGHSNLFRDENTGAIINMDSSAYDQYVNSLENRRSQRKDIENMKNDILEIKTLLRELINGTEKN